MLILKNCLLSCLWLQKSDFYIGSGAVVFDDIDECWQGDEGSDSSPSPSRNCHPGPPSHYFKVELVLFGGKIICCVNLMV